MEQRGPEVIKHFSENTLTFFATKLSLLLIEPPGLRILCHLPIVRQLIPPTKKKKKNELKGVNIAVIPISRIER